MRPNSLNATSAQSYAYVVPTPSITNITPNRGWTDGGALIMHYRHKLFRHNERKLWRCKCVII